MSPILIKMKSNAVYEETAPSQPDDSYDEFLQLFIGESSSPCPLHTQYIIKMKSNAVYEETAPSQPDDSYDEFLQLFIGERVEQRPPVSPPSSKTVHFSPTLVTAMRTRPRTYELDIPDLYYSKEDIRWFKQEYYKSKKLPQHDNNSYWRSKVGRYCQWAIEESRPSSSPSARPSSPHLLALHHQEECSFPYTTCMRGSINIDKPPPQSKSAPNSNMAAESQMQRKSNSLLVDTLYLF